VSFRYDALGRRTGQTLGSMTTEFVYDGLNPTQESTLSSSVNLLTGLGVDEYFASTDADGIVYLVSDALGSTVVLLDGGGVVQTDYTYDPFGQVTAVGATQTPFQYTRRENDGTGLYY